MGGKQAHVTGAPIGSLTPTTPVRNDRQSCGTLEQMLTREASQTEEELSPESNPATATKAAMKEVDLTEAIREPANVSLQPNGLAPASLPDAERGSRNCQGTNFTTQLPMNARQEMVEVMTSRQMLSSSSSGNNTPISLPLSTEPDLENTAAYEYELLPALGDARLMADSDESQIRPGVKDQARVDCIAVSSGEDGHSSQDEPDAGHSGSESEDNEDKYRLESKPERTKKVSERKRIDTALFQSWLENNPGTAKTGMDEKSDSEGMTTTYLVKQSQNKEIISSPREYQLELFETAKKRNTIIVLDTGSGKTLIAMLLLKDVVERELEDRAQGKGPRISFFLVDKVALVDQQWSAIVANLPYKDRISKYFGEEVDRQWNPSYWKEQFSKNMVVVCTAAILQKCLAHSFVKMREINLLILDEAHHAKKNHPYARIMKDYYNREAKPQRPRILGMTASPVDAQVDVCMAAQQLESLLQSRIATVSDGTLDTQLGRRDHDEMRTVYERLDTRVETGLMKKLEGLTANNTVFSKVAAYSKVAAVELGSWFADRYWKLCLAGTEAGKFIAKAEGLAAKAIIPFRSLNPVARARKIRQIVDEHPLPELKRDLEHISTKTNSLLRILDQYFSDNDDHKCIVFVKQRNTAMLLADMFNSQDMKIPHLKPAYLVGNQGDGGPADMSYRDTVVTIHDFRQGRYNCLFASSVAEEGIDIPDCDVIIRFDLARSMIQYIQSKGRARHANSTFINMVESGNSEHSRLLNYAVQNKQALKDFCCALPEDRKLDSLAVEASTWSKDVGHKHYIIQSTGAKLTFSHSLEVLANFVSSLQDASEAHLSPEYLVSMVEDQFDCLVILPDKSPIRTKRGEPQRSKQAAKCSAAFELCVDLIKNKYIDEHLQPVFKKILPAMRNARLALSSNKTASYKMLLKPAFWSPLGPVEKLFCAVLTLDTPQAVGCATCPLILMTRKPLPELPAIPLFFGNGENSMGRLLRLSVPLDVSGDNKRMLYGVTGFTLRVFEDVFSKVYENGPDDLPYFLAPSCKPHSYAFWQACDPVELIDWPAVQLAKDNDGLKIENGEDPKLFYRNRFVTDPFDGGRKMYMHRVRDDLRPSDPVPDSVPAPRHRGWRTVEHNIAEYSCSMWSRSRTLKQWDMSQPVMQAENISPRRNFLDEFDEQMNVECYIIIEPLHISPLSTDLVAMAFLFPAIIHRIDNHLIALDLCALLGLRIRPDLALEAVTKDSDNSEEHGEEKINFQSGMGKNYERLEFLGDCFLKMATTIAIFTQIPDKTEFEYHVERMLLICNKNLFNMAVDRKLQEFVRSRKFDRRTWYPEGLKLIRGKKPNAEVHHDLGDKSIADVCEALIGAAYLTHVDKEVRVSDAMPLFDEAVKAVTAVTNNKRHRMKAWAEYYAGYKMPEWQLSVPSATQREIARLVKETTGYDFKYPAILRSAFKHPSYPYENIPNYQQLEFLGDALLDMVCVDFLFKKFPDADPQWLTEHKMAMVANQFLACLCVQLGFQRYMLCVHGSVRSSIATYVSQLEQAKEVAAAEVAKQRASAAAATSAENTSDVSPSPSPSTSASAARDFWVKVEQPPKCLADIVEAYVGAIFVDSAYDFRTVVAFFERHVRPFFEDMTLYDSFASRHPVTFLANKLASEFGCQEWRVLVREDPPDPDEAGVGCVTDTQVAAGVMVHGKVFSAAKAQSGRYAKTRAAKKAIERLREVKTREEFGELVGCDCKRGGGEDIEMEAHGTAV